MVLFFLPPCLPKGTSRILIRAPFIESDDCRSSEKVESVRPTEFLCQILQFAVGQDGVKALLPFTRVSAHWRRAALGDSSLWTTIRLSQTTPPLLDMILAHAGVQLFSIHIDHDDLGRLPKLWELVDRMEELHCSDGLQQLVEILPSLGAAPNLKVLRLQPGIQGLPAIFSGSLPSLRHLTLTEVIFWPPGLFKGLVSFECGALEMSPLSPVHLMNVLKDSPSIEYVRLAGICGKTTLPTVNLPSLKKCTLTGHGTTVLIWSMTVPASAHVSLDKSYMSFGDTFPKFDNHSGAPGLRVLDKVSAVSVSIDDYAVQIQAKNARGGIFISKEHDLYTFSRDPARFGPFIRSSFDYGRTCPGFQSTKEFTLDVERGKIWQPKEATDFAFDVFGFLSGLPSVEDVKLRGVPPRELASILEFLRRPPEFGVPCPNLKRLHVESTPFRSPWSLLESLGNLASSRKEVGAPLRSLTVKMKCEKLIPVADHCALLNTWAGLVGEGVRLEYERTKVKKIPRCPRYNYPEEDYEDDESENQDVGYQDECEVVSDNPRECYIGWSGWPEKWPKTVGEMRGR